MQCPMMNKGLVYLLRKYLNMMIRISFVVSILLVSSLYLAGQVTSKLVEQTKVGEKEAVEIVASFDGLGYGFEGPQGSSSYRNPSDNSLAVGPDHIMQF